MKRFFTGLLVMTTVGLVHGWPQRMTGEEIEQHKPLTAEELSELVKKGTDVTHTTAAGHAVRRWKNGADGEFVASTSDSEVYGGRPNIWNYGHGKWRVERDHYCVSIVWRNKVDGITGSEDWCRAVYPINGIYYLAPVMKSPAQMKAPYGTAEFSN